MHRLRRRTLPSLYRLRGNLDASPGRRALAPPQAPRAGNLLSGFSALATRMMQRQTEKLSHRYFPRAVFFFGLGFLVLPVLPGAASFFGRFGDTGSLLPGLAVPGCPRVRIRS
jgi:hypothetical protein